MEISVVGKRIPRLDAAQQVKGQSVYANDLPNLPDMLYAKVLTSPYASAEILNIDVSEAKLLKGVIAIITAEDVPNNCIGFEIQDEYVFAQHRTHFVGEAIAAVAAESEEIAQEALSFIKVDYRPLEPVLDPLEAMKENAPKVHEEKDNTIMHSKLRKGDVNKGFKLADHIIEDHFETKPVEQCSIETHGGVADFDNNGKLTVWASTQLPFILRVFLQMVLQMPATKIRVIKTEVGGAFGGKNELSVEHHIALLAKKTGRPVKMIWSREDEFIRSTRRHRTIMDYKTGVKNDGSICAMEVNMVIDNGPIVSWSSGIPAKGFYHIGPYNIPNVKTDHFVVYTNMPPMSSMRGFGIVPQALASETHMDHIAKVLGMDPVLLRLKNALKTGDKLATGQELISCGLTECIEKAASASGMMKEKGGV